MMSSFTIGIFHLKRKIKEKITITNENVAYLINPRVTMHNPRSTQYNPDTTIPNIAHMSTDTGVDNNEDQIMMDLSANVAYASNMNTESTSESHIYDYITDPSDYETMM